MTARPCLRCGEPTTATYCPACRPADRRDRTGDPRWTARWRRLSRQARRLQPACSNCGATTDLTTDHRQPIAAGGPAFPNLTGLDVLCRSCNSTKATRKPGERPVRKSADNRRSGAKAVTHSVVGGDGG